MRRCLASTTQSRNPAISSYYNMSVNSKQKKLLPVSLWIALHIPHDAPMLDDMLKDPDDNAFAFVVIHDSFIGFASLSNHWLRRWTS